jgi:hypothetical protein
MPADIAPLPLQVPHADQESGLGYLLRAFSANGMTLAKARQHLQIPDWRSLTFDHVAILAHATCADPTWLRASLMLRASETPEQYLFHGHRFRCPADPNMGARVCPDCLRERRWCHRAWILPGAVACPDHARLLIDTCGRCQRLITWRRPAADVCNCGRYLKDGSQDSLPMPINLIAEWTAWLNARLDGDDGGFTPEFPGVPRLLGHLSIHGASALVLAFGLIDRPGTPAAPGRRSKMALSATAAAIDRGLDRLGAIDGAPHEVCRWSDFVHAPALETLKRKGVSAADRDCAAHFLSRLTSKTRPHRAGRRSLGQLELFN